MESGQKIDVKKDCIFCKSENIKTDEIFNPKTGLIQKFIIPCPECTQYSISKDAYDDYEKILTDKERKAITRFIQNYNKDAPPYIEIALSYAEPKKPNQFTIKDILENDNTTVTAEP